jgi:hypothetical protein
MSGAKPRGAIAKKRKSPWLEARAEKFRKNKKWPVPEKFNLDSCGVRPVLSSMLNIITHAVSTSSTQG